MSRKIIFAVFIAALATLAQPAHTQWTESERGLCVRDCIGTCEKNPNVSEPQRGRCGTYCSCACSGAEKVEPSFSQFNENFANNKDNETTRAIRALIPACNTRAFGN